VTRDEHLAEAEAALRPVGEALAHARLGAQVNINPVAMQFAIEYAKTHALCALAAAAPVHVPGEVLELAVAGPGMVVEQQVAPTSAHNTGLIVPS
jgi:hypothetical protein